MSAEYITSVGDIAQLPKLLHKQMFSGHAQSRVLFAGRSNVGKSSLLNAITRKNIAHVSKQAGKTRKLNFFLSTYLDKVIVDLPGYGFAKRGPAERRLWAELIQTYVQSDECIKLALLLSDSRHGPTDADIEAVTFFNQLDIPVALVMTKTDQLKNQKTRSQRTKAVKEILADNTQLEMGDIFWTSIREPKSIGALVSFIKACG
jgi:GTP-binding protein